MFYVGLFGVYLAGASMQKYIDRKEIKYVSLALIEASTGIFFVLLNA